MDNRMEKLILCQCDEEKITYEGIAQKSRDS